MKLDALKIQDTLDKDWEVVVEDVQVRRGKTHKAKPKRYRMAANFPVGQLSDEQIQHCIKNPNKLFKGQVAPWGTITK